MAFHAWRASFGVRGWRAHLLARCVSAVGSSRAGRQSRNMWNRLLDLEVILDGGRALCVCENVESCRREPKVARREPNRSLFAFSTIKLCIGNHAGVVAPSGYDKKSVSFLRVFRLLHAASLPFFSFQTSFVT